MDAVTSTRDRFWRLIIGLAVWLPLAGCSSFRLPAVDPTGSRICLPPPNSTGLIWNEPGWQAKFPKPAFEAPPDPEDCRDLAAETAAETSSGAGPDYPVMGEWRASFWRRTLHPVGENATVSLTPGNMIVPIGSEVVLIGGVCDGDGFYRQGEPVEWLLGNGSVGTFLDLNQPDSPLMHGLFHGPVGGKVCHNMAVGETISEPKVLDRGTPETADDVQLEAGQAWISLTSASEGTSQVTFFAPEVPSWQRRQQTALIHWVDAKWTFPPPSFNGGSGIDITTLVNRQSDGGGVSGWIVRYSILGGAPATLSSAEVFTDGSGQAPVRVTPNGPGEGATQIGIQIVRPGKSPAEPAQLVLGQGSTLITWSSASLALAVESLQPQAEAGQALGFRISVTNQGNLAAPDVIVRGTLPAGARVVESTPAQQGFYPAAEWRLGQVNPGQTQTIDVTLQADQPGQIQLCATAQSGSILTSQQCAATQVISPPLRVAISGAANAVVGQRLVFDITVTNLTNQTLTDLVLRNFFDSGLRNNRGASPLERTIPSLAPGESQTYPVGFDVVQAGQQCQRAEVSHSATGTARAEKCIQVIEAARPNVTISVTADRPSVAVGEMVTATMVVTNTGSMSVNRLQVSDQLDSGLELVRASDGYRQEAGQLIWTIPTLPAGAQLTFSVTTRATAANPSVCHRAQVTTEEGGQAADQVCVEITAGAGGATSVPPAVTPPGSGLDGVPPLPPAGTTPPPGTAAQPGTSPANGMNEFQVMLNARPAQAAVRQEVMLIITIQNWTNTPYNQVTPRLFLPDGVRFVSAVSPTASTPRFGANEQEIIFETTEVVRPGERALTYLVRVIPNNPGNLNFRLQVESPDLPQPREAQAAITATGSP